MNPRIAGIIIVTYGFVLVACSSQGQNSVRTDQIPASSEVVDSYDSTRTPEINTEGEAEKYNLTFSPEPPEAEEPYIVSNIWGMQLHGVPSGLQIQLLGDAGAGWMRDVFFEWDKIQPERRKPPDYYWESVDEEVVAQLTSAGVHTLSIQLYAPTWAQKYPGYACGPITEEALSDFGEFVGEMVNRYSTAPYEVKYYEFGNEPDISRIHVGGSSFFGCWGEDEDDSYYGGKYYAEMLKEVYPEMKRQNSEAMLVIGGLLMDCDPINPPENPPGSGTLKDCTPSRFLEGILEAGGGDYFDAVSFHAYDYYIGEYGKYANGNWHSQWDTTGPVLSQKVGYLRSLLDSYGYPEKELFNTEVALICGGDGKEPICLTDDFQNTKAIYLVQAYAQAIDKKLTANIWYSDKGWRGTNIIDANNEPLPAYDAFVFNQQMLLGFNYLGKIGGLPSLEGYNFTDQTRDIWLLWSKNIHAENIQLPRSPNTIYDVFGNQLPLPGADLTYTIDVAPIYIVWDN